MRPSYLTSRPTLENIALTVMLLLLWLLMRGYHGITGDGQIYAFQAMARMHPNLSADLYLQNTSQDRFTLFSPLYAWFIGILGLENASRLLTLLFTFWFLAAVWSCARVISGRDAAWGAVALLLIVSGTYGGSGVFRILEPFLTARALAQALIVTALYCSVRGMKWLSLSLALAAPFIHPLMALPGLLLVICLWLPIRLGVIGAIGGVIATLAISVAAVYLPAVASVVTVMDAPWLEIVRERSQFLFLQLWSPSDWDTNVKPFVYLAFTAVTIPDERTRRLCAAAGMVGAAGLAVALIGGLVGPVAILVQGQAWRWVWITVLVSIVLLPVTAVRAWRDEKCGPLCALLLLSGWITPGIYGTACGGLASLLWLARTHVGSHAATFLRCLSVAIGVAMGVWIFIKCRSFLSPGSVASSRPLSGIAQIQEIAGLKIPAVLLVALTGWGLRIYRTRSTALLISAMLAGSAVLIVPTAFTQARTLASPADVQEFADWTNLIPPTSTVLVAPSHDAGAFVWFTLDRPNYLALDQSAGVVFSRATALEIRRRSGVLLPLMDPEWKILSRLRSQSSSELKAQPTIRPLTAEKLIHVCGDPQLGFVLSPEKVGFPAVTNVHAGTWKDWNLYDCRNVRSAR